MAADLRKAPPPEEIPPVNAHLAPSLFVAAALLAGCGGGRGSSTDLAGADLAGLDLRDPDDHDGDGTSAAHGDCDDGNALVGPAAFEIAGNGVDDDCDGLVDEATPACDSAALGHGDAAALAAALGLCDAKFLLGAELRGPSDPRARTVVGKFGVVQKLEGAGMALLSTGIAADVLGAGYVRPEQGTILGDANTFPNPDPTLPGVAGCGSSQPATVNDYTELAVRLRVPSNARSLSFQLQFFSAEYPEFVCTAWNDELLVELESKQAGGAPYNVSFDAAMNPITVNNGFFTVCKNDPGKPQTQHCTQPIDGLLDTGYDVVLLGRPIGGSTGWLRTTAPVFPNDEITLRFIIFDEGDHIYDSAALLDKFAWSTDVVGGPVTVQ